MTPVLVTRMAEDLDGSVGVQTDPAFSLEFYRRVSSEDASSRQLRTLVEMASRRADPWAWIQDQAAQIVRVR